MCVDIWNDPWISLWWSCASRIFLHTWLVAIFILLSSCYTFSLLSKDKTFFIVFFFLLVASLLSCLFFFLVISLPLLYLSFLNYLSCSVPRQCALLMTNYSYDFSSFVFFEEVFLLSSPFFLVFLFDIYKVEKTSQAAQESFKFSPLPGVRPRDSSSIFPFGSFIDHHQHRHHQGGSLLFFLLSSFFTFQKVSKEFYWQEITHTHGGGCSRDFHSP